MTSAIPSWLPICCWDKFDPSKPVGLQVKTRVLTDDLGLPYPKQRIEPPGAILPLSDWVLLPPIETGEFYVKYGVIVPGELQLSLVNVPPGCPSACFWWDFTYGRGWLWKKSGMSTEFYISYDPTWKWPPGPDRRRIVLSCSGAPILNIIIEAQYYSWLCWDRNLKAGYQLIPTGNIEEFRCGVGIHPVIGYYDCNKKRIGEYFAGFISREKRVRNVFQCKTYYETIENEMTKRIKNNYGLSWKKPVDKRREWAIKLGCKGHAS